MNDNKDLIEHDFGKWRRKTVIIALCLTAGIVILSGCACAGVLWWGAFLTTDISGVRIAADDFLNDLNKGNVERAYDRTSRDFQGSQTLDQFREMVEHYPILAKQRTRSTQSLVIRRESTGPQAHYQGKVYSEDDSLDFGLTLVRERGQWKIEFFLLP